MRDRIPFLFAAVLVAALIGAVGIAAFSTTNPEEPPQEETFEGVVSGRVASAILALSVSAPSTTVTTVPIEAAPPATAEETIEATEPSTTTAPSTSVAPSTTRAQDTTPPPLVIDSPDHGATVTTSVVEFRGTTEPGASVSSGPFQATTNEDGSWTIKLVVSDGYNSTVLTATDSAGNETSERIVVFYDPPAPTTSTTKPPKATTTTKPPATTTTTKPPAATTTTQPPSNCPVSGSCSPNWPADPKSGHNRDFWRPQVEQYWPAERVACVLDLIQVESGGDPQARSPGGNYLGLLQHSYWAWNGRAQAIGLIDGNGLTAHPYNGAANLAAGAWLADNSSPWWKPWPPTKRIASCQALGAQ